MAIHENFVFQKFALVLIGRAIDFVRRRKSAVLLLNMFVMARGGICEFCDSSGVWFFRFNPIAGANDLSHFVRWRPVAACAKVAFVYVLWFLL